MEIPKDVLYGDVLLRVVGNKEIIIENYKGILLYTSEEIAIACKVFTIRIYGDNLHIQYFSGYDMKVFGQFDRIDYISNGDVCY
ncbi:MAG: YabP/YqfC family sporulation protein [Lachnospiraceae bacterium]